MMNLIGGSITPLKEIEQLFDEQFREVNNINQKGQNSRFCAISITIVITIILFFATNSLETKFRGFLFLLAIVIVGVGCIVVLDCINKSVTKKKNDVIAVTDNQVMESMKNLPTDFLSIIPSRYHYSYAMSYIYEMFVNQRATTWKEAVGLYENYLFQNEMARKMEATYSAAIEAREAAIGAQNAARRAENAAIDVLAKL